MKVLIHAFFITLLLSFGAQSVFADGLPPSQEDVCDVLQGEGITGGLFGLCNAYCEAKDCDEYAEGEEPRSCNRILANYDKKRDRANNPLDPEMPCLVEDTPTCPCWTQEQLNARGDGLDPVGCFSIPGLGSAVEYADESGSLMVTFASTPEPGCEYFNNMEDPVIDVDIPDFTPPPLTTEEDALCQAEMATLLAEASQVVPPGDCPIF